MNRCAAAQSTVYAFRLNMWTAVVGIDAIEPLCFYVVESSSTVFISVFCYLLNCPSSSGVSGGDLTIQCWPAQKGQTFDGVIRATTNYWLNV
jgi:hypothetical protein